MSLAPVQNVSFTLNGAAVSLRQPSPHLTLNEWLRAQPGLTGTKKMCGEGGCGCCVVAATVADPSTTQSKTFAINSVSTHKSTATYRAGLSCCAEYFQCLCPLYGVEGWQIRTVEGIGK